MNGVATMQSVENDVTRTFPFVCAILSFFRLLRPFSLVFIFLMYKPFLPSAALCLCLRFRSPAHQTCPTNFSYTKRLLRKSFFRCSHLLLRWALSAVTPFSSYFYLCSFTSWILDDGDVVPHTHKPNSLSHAPSHTVCLFDIRFAFALTHWTYSMSRARSRMPCECVEQTNDEHTMRTTTLIKKCWLIKLIIINIGVENVTKCILYTHSKMCLVFSSNVQRTTSPAPSGSQLSRMEDIAYDGWRQTYGIYIYLLNLTKCRRCQVPTNDEEMVGILCVTASNAL